jgi:hypothetical protein
MDRRVNLVNPGVDFDRIESTHVVAAPVPATPEGGRQNEHSRGSRDKPGHNPAEMPSALT